MPQPYLYQTGKWAIRYSGKLSPNGKEQTVYFATEQEANDDLKSRIGERQGARAHCG